MTRPSANRKSGIRFALRQTLDDNCKTVKRRESQIIGQPVGLSGLTLALTVMLCMGAMSDGASAAIVAQRLSRQAGSTAERESVANLLSSLNEAARKLCRVPAGQHAGLLHADNRPIALIQPTALRPYDDVPGCAAQPPLDDHLLNLPPPAASF